MSEEVEVEEHEVEVDTLVEQRERVQRRLQEAEERVSQHGTAEGFIKRVEASPDGQILTFTVETAAETFKFNFHVLSQEEGVVKSERARAFEKHLDADVSVPDSFIGERVLVRYAEDEPEYVVPPTLVTDTLGSAGLVTVGSDGRIAPSQRGRRALVSTSIGVLVLISLAVLFLPLSVAVVVALVACNASLLPYAGLMLLKRRNTRAFV